MKEESHFPFQDVPSIAFKASLADSLVPGLMGETIGRARGGECGLSALYLLLLAALLACVAPRQLGTSHNVFC